MNGKQSLYLRDLRCFRHAFSGENSRLILQQLKSQSFWCSIRPPLSPVKPSKAIQQVWLLWHGRVSAHGTSLSPVAVPPRGVRVPGAQALCAHGKGSTHAADALASLLRQLLRGAETKRAAEDGCANTTAVLQDATCPRYSRRGSNAVPHILLTENLLTISLSGLYYA